MKKAFIGICMVLVMAAAVLSGEADRFETLKQRMAEAGCHRFEFLSILESDLFKTVDTTAGSALIAEDGRYLVSIGSDTYLYNLENLYSYSTVQNQVVIEPVAAARSVGEGITCITRLDEFYETRILTAGYVYQLEQREGKSTALPATMRLFLRADEEAIDRFEYIDDNDDLNRIVMLNQTLLDSCADSEFLPVFPDSADVVRLD